MRVSSKGDYGLRAMVHLARYHGSGPVSVAELSTLEGVPPGYLEQIVAILRRAGLVSSRRGSHGGYSLAAEPRAISVGDILRALEGPLRLTPCASELVGPEGCAREAQCPCRGLWRRLHATVAGVVDGTTLEDLRREVSATMPSRPVASAGVHKGRQ